VPPTPTVPPVSGSTGIRDDRTHSDSILITLENVPQPPAGQAYAGWLIGNHGEHRLNIGVLSVGADGKITAEYVSPTGENLFAVYDEFIIAREPIGAAPTAPSDQIAYSAVVPAQARQALNRLLVSAPDIKFGTGYLLNLLLMARRVDDQAGVIQKLAKRDDLAGLHRQAEVIVNIVEGEQGKNYGDLDGDGRVLNNGDSLGIWPTDIDRVKEVAQAAIDAPDASAAIQLHAGHVIIGMDNARTWAEQLDAKALELARTPDITAAKTLALDVGALAKKLLEGVDTNNDEVISPIPGEGTIEMAYKHAQFAASPVYQAPITAGGAPLTAAEVTPTPLPAEAPTPTLAPRETIVVMQDFAFAPQTITIKAGTTVMWINQDNAPHTATADDNSFDTGPLTQGQSGSITFDKPGEFPYYCLFHGGPGGVGMAGKIVVTP
jgi:plastocyanin